MGIIIIFLYFISIIGTVIYTGLTGPDPTPWNIFRIVIPGALLLELYIEKLKSEPLVIYGSRFKVGQKINFEYNRYYSFTTGNLGMCYGEITILLKIEMIDKLNKIYYTNQGKFSFWDLQNFGKPIKATWIVKQRKGPKRERR